MDDDIQLPPLQHTPPMYVYSGTDLESYARAAVLADRERRERRAKVAEKPVVHKAILSLGQNGSWSCYPPSVHHESTIVTLCWTADDGRVWIESEQNREQAAMLRQWEYHGAADALDGGV